MIWRKKTPLINLANSALLDLPAPSNISHMWNFGSLLAVCLISQTVTGIFLAMHYSANIAIAFNCIDHIMRDVDMGWLTRLIHANGASLFFLSIYIHIGRNLYFHAFFLKNAWTTGIFIFAISMATAFLGYVLPWGQMSYWGATVITNLLTAIPYLGNFLVVWVWGGYSVDNSTLSRFFSLHYLLPFVLFFLVLVHLVFIHEQKSSNPLGISSNFDKISFHPYFTTKDCLSMILVVFLFMMINMWKPFILMDPDNFTPANPLVTPTHIQPEWYFLFAYAILRAIPNKLGGVMALAFSIFILLLLLLNQTNIQNKNFHKKNYFFWYFLLVFFFLTLLGMKPIEVPYLNLSIFFTLMYFSWFLI